MFSRTVMALATLSLFPLQSMAEMKCGPGLTHVNVNGSVTTLNVSDTKQVGQICLTMVRTANGREVFNDCGALVGKIVSADVQAGSRTLTHTAVFDLRDMFRTRNDQAQIKGILDVDENYMPCAFIVEETISEFDKGVGIFLGATIHVTAEGSISFCPGKNLNTFTLKGEACVVK